MGKGITTYTKIEFDTMHPDMELIQIEDIAHALSMLVRANGHFPEFFSVAQHCIQCVKEAMARNYTPEVALACLLHDASEAYLSDITRPVKRDMIMYLQIEEQLQNMIYEKYLGAILEKEAASLVANIDDACLYYEFLHFMDIKIFPAKPVLVSEPVYDLLPMKDVEQEFLELFYALNQKMNLTESY